MSSRSRALDSRGTRSAGAVKRALRQLADPVRAKVSISFFKTGPGQYGEGDKFLGVSVPNQRLVAKKSRGLPLSEVKQLLMSRYHEDRLTALLLLVYQYETGTPEVRNDICKFYLQHTRYINNWDLVDTSAPCILGPWLQTQPDARQRLRKLASSKLLWERRIAVLATFHFIKAGRFRLSLELAEYLLTDRHDLMHKAVSWMLREIGKRNRPVLEQFLITHCQSMPRTMLRYAIEHFDAAERQRFLNGNIHPQRG